jgi:hypothetical protein
MKFGLFSKLLLISTMLCAFTLPASAGLRFRNAESGRSLNIQGFPSNGKAINVWDSVSSDQEQLWSPIDKFSNASVDPFTGQGVRFSSNKDSAYCMNLYVPISTSRRLNNYQCVNNDLGQVYKLVYNPNGNTRGYNIMTTNGSCLAEAGTSNGSLVYPNPFTSNCNFDSAKWTVSVEF